MSSVYSEAYYHIFLEKPGIGFLLFHCNFLFCTLLLFLLYEIYLFVHYLYSAVNVFIELLFLSGDFKICL